MDDTRVTQYEDKYDVVPVGNPSAALKTAFGHVPFDDEGRLSTTPGARVPSVGNRRRRRHERAAAETVTIASFRRGPERAKRYSRRRAETR